ncbi:MAG: hypothetical protein OFPI_26300 [Osedax symbiont Rs2]|nr:MAG: hypothetical protein OFPI_26300 [Osedax symbiont Rs2]
MRHCNFVVALLGIKSFSEPVINVLISLDVAAILIQYPEIN